MSGAAWGLLGVLLVATGAAAPQAGSPQVHIEAPPEFAAVRTRLESVDPKRLADILQLVGIQDAGPPIRVILSPEGSDLAHRTSAWIAGFAIGSSGEVVIFPTRVPQYPHYSLEDVLRHEIAHVLVSRAAGDRPVPRWFNEGVAMAAERAWGLEDYTRFLYQTVFGPRTSLIEIDSLFLGDRQSQERAYALSGSFVRGLVQQYGPETPGEILSGVRTGVPFDLAFADAAGVTLSGAEADFWRRQKIWTSWIPLLMSPEMLWLVITVLALVAIRRRRRRDAEMRKKWDQEEAERVGGSL